VFVDAIHVKVRDGAVANRPFYAAIGVDLQGHRDVLGVWAGTPGAGESSGTPTCSVVAKPAASCRDGPLRRLRILGVRG
jgi:Transposase, Mutator family